ncbi:MAG: hypothetical protein AAGK21_00745 [Bacteroidota bacterium]
MRVLLLGLPLLIAGCAADAANDTRDLRLGPFQQVDGTRHLRATLGGSGQSNSRTSISDGYSPGYGVNVLFYDLDGREGRWLFDGAPRAILSDDPVRDSLAVQAFLFEVVEEDTNSDDELTPADARTLFIADPEGRRVVPLAEGVEGLRQQVRLDEGRVLVLFDANDAVEGVEVELETLKAEPRIAMPPAPSAGV